MKGNFQKQCEALQSSANITVAVWRWRRRDNKVKPTWHATTELWPRPCPRSPVSAAGNDQRIEARDDAIETTQGWCCPVDVLSHSPSSHELTVGDSGVWCWMGAVARDIKAMQTAYLIVEPVLRAFQRPQKSAADQKDNRAKLLCTYIDYWLVPVASDIVLIGCLTPEFCVCYIFLQCSGGKWRRVSISDHVWRRGGSTDVLQWRREALIRAHEDG